VPAFEFLFLNNRLFDVVGGFDIDESLRVELFGEAVIQTLAVFPRAAGDVVCDADLERAVALVGQDVDVIGHGFIFCSTGPRIKSGVTFG
jgi:hypothetical protein